MKLRIALLLSSAIAVTACDKVSQLNTPPPICQELDATIDSNIRKAALILVEGEYPTGSYGYSMLKIERATRGAKDGYAIQSPAQYMSVSNHLQVIQINLKLQSQHKCPPRQSAINPLAFNRDDVIKCQLAIEAGKDAPKLCDINSWKRSSD